MIIFIIFHFYIYDLSNCNCFVALMKVLKTCFFLLCINVIIKNLELLDIWCSHWIVCTWIMVRQADVRNLEVWRCPGATKDKQIAFNFYLSFTKKITVSEEHKHLKKYICRYSFDVSILIGGLEHLREMLGWKPNVSPEFSLISTPRCSLRFTLKGRFLVSLVSWSSTHRYIWDTMGSVAGGLGSHLGRSLCCSLASEGMIIKLQA